MSNIKEIKTFKVYKQHKQTYSGGICNLHYNSNLIACKNDTLLSFLNLNTGENVYDIDCDEDHIIHFCLTPNGEYMVLSCRSTLLKVFTFEERSNIFSLGFIVLKKRKH